MPASNVKDTSTLKEALKSAQDAAHNQDTLGIIQGLFDSMLLEGFEKSFERKYPKVDPDDIYDIIGIATDELCGEISKGRKIFALDRYLWKIIDDKLSKHVREQKLFRSLSDENLDVKAPGIIPERLKEKREIARKKAIEIAESLMPRLGQANVQEVMTYVLGAIKNGVQDLNSTEIGDALALKPGTVRVCIMRGFERLARIVKDEKLVDESYEFPSLEEMEIYIEEEEI